MSRIYMTLLVLIIFAVSNRCVQSQEAWQELVFGVSGKEAIMKTPSILDWYRILRAHHTWTVFQAVRYALWLTR